MKRRRLSTTISQTSWDALRQFAAAADLTLSEALDRMIDAAMAHPAIAELGAARADEAGGGRVGRSD